MRCPLRGIDSPVPALPHPVPFMPAVRLALLLAAATPLGQAAPLSVTVTDAAGKPLADAVVMLEPATGKAPVKPLPDVEISQAKRQFNPRVTLITVGTRVAFPNFDTVRHHVYSFSQAKTFELKLYAGVPAAPIVFDKPGAGRARLQHPRPHGGLGGGRRHALVRAHRSRRHGAHRRRTGRRLPPAPPGTRACPPTALPSFRTCSSAAASSARRCKLAVDAAP